MLLQFTYDNGGNILSIVRYPLTWGSLDGVTARYTTNYAYDDTNWKDKMTSFNNLDITYDEIGNPLQYKGFTLTWQNGRQLASMQIMQMRFEFTYDVDGLRTSKKILNVDLEHKYYYVGSRLQYETLNDNSALYYFYDSDGNPSGVRYQIGSTFTDYYYVCNWRGDVVEIYNSAGVLVASYDYDAWGVTLTHSTDADTQHIADLNPLRYRGYYYDSETSMYYVNSRYYDPATKRFLNADKFVSANGNSLKGNNLFEYCNNNPINKVDSGGDWPKLAKKIGNWIKKEVIQPIKKFVTKSKKSIAVKVSVCNSNRRPYTGEPGSTYKAPNGDTRTYGPNGLPQHDYDSNDHGNPSNHPHDENGGHNHDWVNGVRGPAYAMNLDAVLGTALIIVSFTGMVVVLANDMTIVGMLDNFLLGPLVNVAANGIKLVY